MKRILFIISLFSITLIESFGQSIKVLKQGDFDYYEHHNPYVKVCKDNKCGMSDYLGNLFIPMEYEDIVDYSSVEPTPLIRAKKNGKWGCIDRNGKTIIPFLYDEVSPHEDFVLITNGRKNQTLDFQNNILWDSVPDNIYFNRGAAIVKSDENHKYGFINQSGKFIFDFIFEKEAYFDYQKAVVWDEKQYVIDLKGNKFPMFNYKIERVLPENTFLARGTNNKLGLINLNQEVIIPFEFDDYIYFSPDNENLITLKKENHYRLYDFKGKVLFSSVYDEYGVSKEFIFLKKANKYTIFSKKMKKIIHENVEDINSLTYLNHICKIKKNGKWGLINNEGDILAECLYDDVFTNTLNVIGRKGEKYGLLDTKGNIIQSFMYSHLFYEHEWLLSNITGAVGEKYGVLDYNGKEIVPFEYDNLNHDKAMYYQVEKGEKSGLINQRNEIIIPIDYDFLEAMRDSLFYIAKKENSLGIFDYKGKIIFPFEYQSIKYNTEGKYILKKQDKYGLFVLKDKKIIPCEYESISGEYNFAIVQKDGKKGIVNFDNQTIKKIEYDLLEEIHFGYGKTYLYRAKKGKFFSIIDRYGITKVDYLDDFQYSHDGIYVIQNGIKRFLSFDFKELSKVDKK